MEDRVQNKSEKTRIALGTAAIIAIVSVASIAATLLGMSQMA